MVREVEVAEDNTSLINDLVEVGDIETVALADDVVVLDGILNPTSA